MAKSGKPVDKAPEANTGARYEELKQMLVERQEEIMAEVQGKIREIRANGVDNPRRLTGHRGDGSSNLEVDIQEDIVFALIQMKAKTLQKINEALARLEEGAYGHCLECGDEIAQPRLRALPFAIRCKDCEEAQEMAQQRERIRARHRDFFDTDFSPKS